MLFLRFLNKRCGAENNRLFNSSELTMSSVSTIKVRVYSLMPECVKKPKNNQPPTSADEHG